MRTEPQLPIYCDKCDVEELAPLTTLANGAYDERNVDKHLEHLGWDVSNGDICPECKANPGQQEE